MDGGSPGWIPRLLAGGLTAAVAAGGVLLAQVVEKTRDEPAARAAADAATRLPGEVSPSAGPPATQASAEDTVQPALRARLLSGLIGSKHDFTENRRLGPDPCLACHTPHLAAAPLPRLDRRSTTTQPLRPYQGVGVELSGWTLLCLGCHDGTTAPDVYSTSHATTVAGQLANSRLGSRGLRSHPVGIKYPSTGEDYRPRPVVQGAGLRLPEGRIQCTTCHDPHNTKRHSGMLRISDERSRMCLTCHRL